ncbi:hypothetical protein BH23ACT9_BH23ACT9_39530 [soil metagenome]
MALAGGPAAARNRAPMLLTRRDDLPRATAVELVRLQSSRIVVLGASGAVSDDVAAQLAQHASRVDRIGGAGRYDTAALVPAATFSAGLDVVYLATGEDFPDALAGVPAAAAAGAPVLLVENGRMPDVVAAQIQRLNPSRIFVGVCGRRAGPEGSG